jgi:hypothetical protein
MEFWKRLEMNVCVQSVRLNEKGDDLLLLLLLLLFCSAGD